MGHGEVSAENESSRQVRNAPQLTPRWRKFINALLATEISALARYCDSVLQVAPRGDDTGILLAAIDNKNKSVLTNVEELPAKELCDNERRDLILLNGNFNHDYDIESLLRRIWLRAGRGVRVVAVSYNPYLRWLYSWANKVGLRSGEEPTTFLTSTDLTNIAKLAGFEVVRIRPVAFCPWELAGIGTWINRILTATPLLRWFSLTTIITLRPIKESLPPPTFSVVIPARNERGNIENALKRLGEFGGRLPEVVFVEGNSSDGTWEEIERVAAVYGDRFPIKTLKQSGKGKADAVRLGFAHATGELLAILDADLTMPPELLPRFYDAYATGKADFINGSRLVYPMEGAAMRFLNRLGNVFFAKALSFVLESRIGDSLCGTKLITKRDYQRVTAWRSDFGDFDPFGDFELLFPAAILGLGIVDVPVRYRDRVYGSTNIRRFRDGFLLLRMTMIGFFRVLLGRGTR